MNELWDTLGLHIYSSLLLFLQVFLCKNHPGDSVMQGIGVYNDL